MDDVLLEDLRALYFGEKIFTHVAEMDFLHGGYAVHSRKGLIVSRAGRDLLRLAFGISTEREDCEEFNHTGGWKLVTEKELHESNAANARLAEAHALNANVKRQCEEAAVRPAPVLSMPSPITQEQFSESLEPRRPERERFTNVAPTLDALKVQIGGGHYKDFKIQPIEFIEANSLPFLEGCIIKRVCRHAKAKGVEDLNKIKHEVDLLIQLRYQP